MAKFNRLVGSNAGKVLGFCSVVLPLAILACSSEPSGDGDGDGGDGNTGGNGVGGSTGGTTQGGAGGSTGGTITGGNGGTIAGGNGGGGGGNVGGDGGGANPGGNGGGGGTTGDGSCANLPDVKGHPDCDFDYPMHDGFTLALVEEFENPIDLVNDPIWTYSDGHPDGPVRFVKENVQFEAGYMNLVMTDDPVAGSHSYAEEEDVNDRAYSSGELRTKYNNYRYGRYEVRFKAPEVQPGNTTINGGYVATMFVFRTPKFTQWREIDLEKTGTSPNTMDTNLINGDNHQQWGADFSDTGNSPVTIPFNAREDFHDYVFEWTSAGVTWYVDGQQIRQQLGAAKLQIPTESTKIMMNLWWGSFGGDAANNQYPLTTQYEWFRFYKWNMDDTYPCYPTPGCLPQTDLDGAKNNPEDGVTYIPPNNGN
jgi:beta-glucanase (GH16 family)